MPFWTVDANEPKANAELVALAEEYEGISGSQDFTADYMVYVRLLGILPHPALAPLGTPSLVSLEEVERAERETVESVRAHLASLKDAAAKKTKVAKNMSTVAKPAKATATATVAAMAMVNAASKAAHEVPADSSPVLGKSGGMVRIRGYAIDNGTAQAASKALKCCDGVASLNLERVEISKQNLAMLIASVAQHRSIRTIILDGTDLSKMWDSSSSLAGVLGEELLKGHPLEALTQPGCTIQQMSMRYCKVDDATAKVLAEIIKKNTSIISLDLWNNSIGDEGGSAIAIALRKNSTLQALSLSRNRIGVIGGEAMVNTLSIYPLPYEELVIRKKQKLELEQKKADLLAVRKQARAQKAVADAAKKPSMAQMEKPAAGAAAGGPGKPNKRKDAALEEQLEEQLRQLAPVEERGGQWYVAGNRTVSSLLMAHNTYTEAVANSLLAARELNKALNHLTV